MFKDTFLLGAANFVIVFFLTSAQIIECLYTLETLHLDISTVLTRGVQYVMKTAQYIPKFYIYTLHNYFYLKICFLAK